MSLSEFKLLLVLAAVFCVYTFVFKQSFRSNALVFLLACAASIPTQLLLGPELNRYTPNITLYVRYVSLAVIVTWGIGLTSIHALHNWAARLLLVKPGMVLYLSCAIPVIIILEITGSNFIRMKLHNYARFSPLLPQANAMHAPVWLYVYYGVVAVVFYRVLRALLPNPASVGAEKSTP
jgi:hypothetical protein